MKNHFLLLIPFFLCIIGISACNQVRFEKNCDAHEVYNLKGNVKAVNSIRRTIVFEDGETEERDGESYKFNKQGNLTYKKEYYQYTPYVENIYYTNDEKITTSDYYDDDELVSHVRKETIKYTIINDSLTQFEKEILAADTLQAKSKGKIVYDRNNNIVDKCEYFFIDRTESKYYNTGTTNGIHNEYDSKEHLIWSYQYTIKGDFQDTSLCIERTTPMYQYEYENDKLVQISYRIKDKIRVSQHNKDGDIISGDGVKWEYEYEYDIHRNWVTKLYFYEGRLSEIIEREIEYYSDASTRPDKNKNVVQTALLEQEQQRKYRDENPIEVESKKHYFGTMRGDWVGYYFEAKLTNASDETFVGIRFHNGQKEGDRQDPYAEIELGSTFLLISYIYDGGGWNLGYANKYPEVTYEKPWKPGESKIIKLYLQPDISGSNGEGLKKVHFEYLPNSCIIYIPIVLATSYGEVKFMNIAYNISKDYEKFSKR